MNKLVKEKARFILENNLKYKQIFDEIIDRDKIYSFEFINKSNITNHNKLQYINEKINESEKNGYVNFEDLKILKVGRFI